MPTAAPVQNDPSWVALAVFAQPHGVRGRIKLKSLSDGPEDFLQAPALTDAHGAPVALRVTGQAQGMCVVEIEGVTTREQAEQLRGRKIGAPRASLPVQENPNRFYIRDLIGLEAITMEGVTFGRVTGVVNYGASDILEITRPDGTEALFAFTHATFPEIDLARGCLRIAPPEVIVGGKSDSDA